MRQVGAEAMLVPKPAREGLQHGDRDLLLGTAAPADEVAVALGVGAVPARDAVVEMRVGDVAKRLERLEVPVHSGRVDLRMTRANACRDVLRRHVMARALQRLQDQAALDRHPHAARTQTLVDPHRASVAQTRACCNRPLLRLFAISLLAR